MWLKVELGVTTSSVFSHNGTGWEGIYFSEYRVTDVSAGDISSILYKSTFTH